MGYDITFHPFSRKEFHYYIEQVVDNPNNFEEQNMALHGNPDEQAFIKDAIYGHMARFKGDTEAGMMAFEKGIGSAMAAIFGYLHPYWYARGGMLSRLSEPPFDTYRGEIAKLVTGPSKPIFNRSMGVIMENYSSGVYVPYEKIAELMALLTDPDNDDLVEEAIGGVGNRDSLLCCLEYCQLHQLDLLEASDVYVPISGECSSLPENFRAEYKQNVMDFTNSGRSLPLF